MKIKNHHNKIMIFFLIYTSGLKSSSLNVLLKLSKTSFPQKLFDYDCVTLFLCLFRNVKPCNRCLYVTVDPVTADKHKKGQPLKLLR